MIKERMRGIELKLEMGRDNDEKAWGRREQKVPTEKP